MNKTISRVPFADFVRPACVIAVALILGTSTAYAAGRGAPAFASRMGANHSFAVFGLGAPVIGSGAAPVIGSGLRAIGSGAAPVIGSGAAPVIGSGAAPVIGSGLRVIGSGAADPVIGSGTPVIGSG
jgi:hypothetical protein